MNQLGPGILPAGGSPAGRGTACGIFLFLTVLSLSAQQPGDMPESSFKILHVMSYNPGWAWNIEQFNGFKAALDGIDVEYRTVEMDAKNRSSPAWLTECGQTAMELAAVWKPDLIYTNDDVAQEYFGKYCVNFGTPLVFSAVNSDPSLYSYTGSENVTGVLEQEHFLSTVTLLKELDPGIAKIAMIFDTDSMWEPVIGRVKAQLSQLTGVEIVAIDIIRTFDEYKSKITAYQRTVDALGLIGIFLFKDEYGNNVPYTDVLRWTAENSSLADFSFWEDRITYGTLCAVTVSGYQQGYAAGDIARRILTEKTAPSTIAMRPTLKGEPVINLARAEKIGIKIRSNLLLSARIVKAIE